MIASLLLSLGVALITYGIYKWVTLNDDYFAKRNVKYLKPYFLFGNTGGLMMKQHRITDFLTYFYNSFPSEKYMSFKYAKFETNNMENSDISRIFGFFDFRVPYLFIRDPEIAKQLAVRDFDHFEDHKLFIDEKVDVLFGNSLIMLHGEKWRDMRATLSPAFTGSKMRQMFEFVNECASDMAMYFKKQSQNGEELNEEMKLLFSKYTNDVIASSAFGIKINSFENDQNEFYQSGKQLMNFNSIMLVIRLLLLRIAPSVMHFLGIQLLDSTSSKFFKSMVLNTFEVREKQNIVRPDMVNIMMQVKKGSSQLQQQTHVEEQENDGFATVEESSIGRVTVKREWSEDEIVTQCFLFFGAGFETSSTLLSFAAHELTVNPEVQDNLYAEIAETNKRLNGKVLHYDELQKMKYLDQVISEVLRMWPPNMLTDRVCVKDYDYDDGIVQFKIEKGTPFWIPMYAFHHDPKYFPNPSKFDPDRFSEGNRDKIVPGSYIPFGIGPRNCIGSRFALMEVKAVIYYLLLNFKLEPNEKTQIPLILTKSPAGLHTEKGVHVHLKPR